MESRSNIPYDPRISALVARTDEEWGSPEDNARNLVFYGLNYVDQQLYGIDVIRGELIGIQAEAKHRKSTMLANVVLNIAAARRFWVCIDTLESGMPPSAYRDVLISIVATRLLIADIFGDARKAWPPYHDMTMHPTLARQLHISKEFLWYRSRTPEQKNAIERAKAILSSLPIMIFGPSPNQGNARDLARSSVRWDFLYNGTHPSAENCSARIFCVDHIQQMDGFGDSDYQRMESVVSAYSSFITTHPGSVVFAVSQLGVSSVRLEKQSIARAMAKGGNKLEAEANVLFRTKYDGAASPHQVIISTDATRRSPPPPIIQELEPYSGAFLRPATVYKNHSG